jgi:hypothetical protein
MNDWKGLEMRLISVETLALVTSLSDHLFLCVKSET